MTDTKNIPFVAGVFAWALVGLALQASEAAENPVLATSSAAVSTWSLNPGSVLADQSTLITLRNSRYTCNSIFTHNQVTLQDSSLYFAFSSSENPAAGACAPSAQTYGPSFQLPPLKSGAYKVYVTDRAECLWSEPACKIAEIQEDGGVLRVSNATTENDFTIAPTKVNDNAAFDLQLLSYAYSCATTFTHLAASVSGTTVTLSYVATEKTGIACPAIYKPYGPTFHLTALSAGKYTVFAEANMECMYSNPACLVATQPQTAGTLTVGSPTSLKDSAWFVKTKEVAANNAFTLTVLSQRYGSCETEFTNPVATVAKASIHLSFETVSHPDHVCLMDTRPFGPEFKMEPLSPGHYEVSIVTGVCPPNAVCIVGPVITVVDTLIVTSPLSIGSAQRGERGLYSRRHAPGALEIVMPGKPQQQRSVLGRALPGKMERAKPNN
jgi:hypothetical protein